MSPLFTRFLGLTLIALTCRASAMIEKDPGIIPIDYASIRGANYCAAAGHHLEHWMNYTHEETARDLDNAKKIGINQVRVFLSYQAYTADKEKFRKNLLDLAHACQARGIGLMLVIPYTPEMIAEAAPYPLSRAWAQDLLDTVGKEPALQFWDVANEPDFHPNAAELVAHGRAMAGIFKELDPRKPRTPVTIGFCFEKPMERNADAVDVLSFHDYSTTRHEIRQNITAAQAFAAKVKKPVINTEIGCTGRANPYDVTIQEFSNAHMGFYIWELMITGYWGNIHGVFYPDGTVRDPSIAAAMMGIFRNRSANVTPELPDRENRVTNAVADIRKWLAASDAPYDHGLDLAETAANLLEANQLVAMHDLPTRHVDLLRDSETPDPAALRALLTDFAAKLEPYQKAKQPQPKSKASPDPTSPESK